MRCPRCGAWLEYGRICDRCGLRITREMIQARQERKNRKTKGVYGEKIQSRHNNKDYDKKPVWPVVAIILSVLIIIAVVAWLIIQICTPDGLFSKEKQSGQSVTRNYGSQISNSQSIAEQSKAKSDSSKAKEAMESAVESAKKLLKETPYDDSVKDSLENAISDAKNAKDESSYRKVTEGITASMNDYERSVKQLKQITNPKESFLLARAKTVDTVTEVEAATEDTDRNNQLHKNGGYNSYIAMKSSMVEDKDIQKMSPVEAGTDGGAVIEAFKTAEEAETRDKYLGSFDGAGMFASGSHKIIGSLVVRTSTKLKASQQRELEQKVIDALLKVDD